MAITRPRAVRLELAALRSQWRVWRNGGPHPAYGLVCPTRCGDCEACAITAYRANRLDEITVRAGALR